MGFIMHKDELKSLVTQMYKELLEHIDTQEEATREQVISYLQDAALTIADIDDTLIDSTEHAKLAFTNKYKEIANKSLHSYKQSNEIFEKIANIHQETISDCMNTQIDIDGISEKFNTIQEHMTAEITRANSVITKLSEQVKELEHNSNLDALTKIFNRRALIAYLDNICSKGTLAYNLHVLMLDIDDFKSVNDTYGHLAGDKVLIFIANILRKTLRDGDKVFRYGGEEFVIVLNRISKQECRMISDRILKLISSNKLIYKGQSLNVTVSIGATKYNSGDTPESLIFRADTALYKSKQNGKNQMNAEIITNGN